MQSSMTDKAVEEAMYLHKKMGMTVEAACMNAWQHIMIAEVQFRLLPDHLRVCLVAMNLAHKRTGRDVLTVDDITKDIARIPELPKRMKRSPHRSTVSRWLTSLEDMYLVRRPGGPRGKTWTALMRFDVSEERGLKLVKPAA